MATQLSLYAEKFGFHIVTPTSTLYAQNVKKSMRVFIMEFEQEEELYTNPDATVKTEAIKSLEWYTPKELCDQCGVAQAFYRVEFSSGYLFFCRHHYTVKENTLIKIAVDIVDESELL